MCSGQPARPCEEALVQLEGLTGRGLKSKGSWKTGRGDDSGVGGCRHLLRSFNGPGPGGPESMIRK